jgi:hypothetical protein
VLQLRCRSQHITAAAAAATAADAAAAASADTAAANAAALPLTLRCHCCALPLHCRSQHCQRCSCGCSCPAFMSQWIVIPGLDENTPTYMFDWAGVKIQERKHMHTHSFSTTKIRSTW